MSASRRLIIAIPRLAFGRCNSSSRISASSSSSSSGSGSSSSSSSIVMLCVDKFPYSRQQTRGDL